MRRWLVGIILITFTSGQVAHGYPQSDVPQLKNFLQKSGWSKHKVKLRDLYQMTKHTLPLKFRFEVEMMLKQNPNLELPKIEIRSIKNGKFEDIQLIAQEGRQAATATLMFHGDQVAELTYAHGGKDIKKKLTYADLYNPVRMMSQVYGPGTGIADQINFTRLLYKDELALLRDKDRLRYSEQVREVLRLAERAQQEMDRKKEAPSKRGPKKTSSRGQVPLILQLLLSSPNANAAGQADGDACFTLGWVGTYKGGICTPPDEALDAKKCPGAHVCSKLFYGPNAECGKTKPASVNSTAELCNARNKDRPYDIFLGVKTQEDFDAKNAEISLLLNNIRAQCKEAKNEQIKECADMETRMAEIEQVNCDVLKKTSSFNDLTCSTAAPELAGGPAIAGADTPVPPPYEGGGLDGEGTPGNETAPATEAKPDPNCEGLPLSASGLDCAGGQSATITCNSQGEARTYYYCVCAGDLRDRFSRSAKPIGCDSTARKKYVEYDEKGRYKEKYKSKKTWWQKNGGTVGLIGGVLTVGVGILAYYLHQQKMKEQWGAYYKMMTPEPLKIAPPPVTAPVIPGAPGVPVVPTGPVYPGQR